VAVFDSTGKYVSAFGRLGDGPGEFAGGGARAVAIVRGDTISVVDRRGRLVLFSPTFEPVRTIASNVGATPRGIVALSSGGFVFSASIQTPDKVGLPFHAVDAHGGLTSSFGGSQPDVRPGRGTNVPLGFIVAEDGLSVWAPKAGYGAAQARTNGTGGLVVEVMNVPWMPTSERMKLDTVLNGQRTIVDIAQAGARLVGVDSAGLLWFNGFAHVVELTPQMVVAGRTTKVVQHLEIVDPIARQLLVSQEMEPAFSGFVRGGHLVYGALATPDGVITFDVWRLEFHRR
jgi:hypothetical protein